MLPNLYYLICASAIKSKAIALLYGFVSKIPLKATQFLI